MSISFKIAIFYNQLSILSGTMISYALEDTEKSKFFSYLP